MDNCYAPKDNVRPLNISEQATVAYWFEASKSDELIYCEVSLTEDHEPRRTTIRNSRDLEDQLRDPEMTFTFTLARINTKQGEPILVYSKPTLAVKEMLSGGRRTSVM